MTGRFSPKSAVKVFCMVNLVGADFLGNVTKGESKRTPICCTKMRNFKTESANASGKPTYINIKVCVYV